ncbi:MAG: pentapeptide repeat-containing protein [Symploca sp. SIO2G7]|nr:pentapeptide repeat-containing protein [Symploca sp. SIO2G7]
MMMADSEHLECLKQGVEIWNQWREENPEIVPDLSNVYLSEAYMGEASLSGANFNGTQLNGASLHEVDLRNVKLSRANLSGAKLRGVDLRGVDLQKLKMAKADLSGADLSGANLTGTYLRGAKLRGTKLCEAILCGVNLSRAKLRGADFSASNLDDADLNNAKLRGANLRGAKLSGANLSEIDLREVQLQGVDLSNVKLRKVELNGTNLLGVRLCGADLNGANLSDAYLRDADLSDANLSNAQLIQAQALGTNFENSIFTGACLQDWNINSTTKFDGVACEYVYLQVDQRERRPREGIFQLGEFTALFQQVLDTVDLIFKDGIDWQAFFHSFQDLRNQYADDNLSIQAIEKKQGEAFVVRLEVVEGADKKAIESSAQEFYATKLTLLEQRYRAELQAKDGAIIAYREQSANLMKITEMLAARPPMSETPKYDLRGAQFAGGFAETVEGDQLGGTINNQTAVPPSLAEAAAEIQNLLKQLEASNSAATEADQTAFLNVMIPPTRRERFIGALKTASDAAIEEVPYRAVLKALVEGWQNPNR